MRQERPFTAALGSGENVHGPIGEVRNSWLDRIRQKATLIPKTKIAHDLGWTSPFHSTSSGACRLVRRTCHTSTSPRRQNAQLAPAK